MGLESFSSSEMAAILPQVLFSIRSQKVTDVILYVISKLNQINEQLLRVYYIDGLNLKTKKKTHRVIRFLRIQRNRKTIITQGHGAFGKVYRAVHKQTKRTFALKKIVKKEIKAQNMITQLNNQIKISRQLDHPNIIRLFDTIDDK